MAKYCGNCGRRVLLGTLAPPEQLDVTLLPSLDSEARWPLLCSRCLTANRNRQLSREEMRKEALILCEHWLRRAPVCERNISGLPEDLPEYMVSKAEVRARPDHPRAATRMDIHDLAQALVDGSAKAPGTQALRFSFALYREGWLGHLTRRHAAVVHTTNEDRGGFEQDYKGSIYRDPHDDSTMIILWAASSEPKAGWR